jgi:hypothetical protein
MSKAPVPMWSILDNETEPYGPENVCRWINGPYRTGTFHVVEATEKTLAADEAFAALEKIAHMEFDGETFSAAGQIAVSALAKAQPARKGDAT